MLKHLKELSDVVVKKEFQLSKALTSLKHLLNKTLA